MVKVSTGVLLAPIVAVFSLLRCASADGPEPRMVLKGHNAEVTSLAFSPDGKTLVTASGDRTAKLWDLGSGKEVKTLQGHRHYVNSVHFSPNGKLIATGSEDRTVRLWHALSGKELRNLEGHSDTVHSVVFSPDSKTLASASGPFDKGEVRLWDVATGRQRLLLEAPMLVRSLAFGPDGNSLATGHFDRTVRLWNAGTGQELRVLKGHRGSGGVSSVVFSPDGSTLATAGDRTARIWEVATGKELASLKHDYEVYSVAFSPDGKSLAAGGGVFNERKLRHTSGHCRLWDLATQKEQLSLHDTDAMGVVAFSPDGKVLATNGARNTAKLWDLPQR